jgi:hypothetical protein
MITFLFNYISTKKKSNFRFGIEHFIPSLESTGLSVKPTILQHSRCSLPMEEGGEDAIKSKSGLYDFLFERLSIEQIECTSFLLVLVSCAINSSSR